MGLDINLVLGLTRLSPEQLDEDGEPLNYPKDPWDYVRLWENTSFPGRADGIEPGPYLCRERSSVFSAAYSTYGSWRERLARSAGYPLREYDAGFGTIRSAHAAACWDGAEGPFSELINFSDCEGYLGPVVCRKLAGDFANHRPPVMENDPTYEKFAEAFRLAAEHDGAVVFS